MNKYSFLRNLIILYFIWNIYPLKTDSPPKQGKRLKDVECYDLGMIRQKGGTSMAMPVGTEEVERVLRPWLGSLFVNTHPLAEEVANDLRAYAPYRQSLEDLRNELESLLLRKLNALTNRSLTVILDNYRSRKLTMVTIADITDDLMGIIFDKLTPFSANFIKLNDYSLRVESLNALRVLYQKYASYYSKEEFAFMVNLIKTVYPPQRWESWLHD